MASAYPKLHFPSVWAYLKDTRPRTSSKLANTRIVSHLIGGHDAEYATWVMHDLVARLANRVQLTSDGR